MSQKLLRTLASFALLASLGCEDEAIPDDVSYTARPVEDGLLFAPSDQGPDHHALLLDVSGEDPKTSKLMLPGGTVTSFARPGMDGQVVLLTSGLEAVRSGKDKRAAVPSSVLIFGKAGQILRRDLQGRYQNLSLSPDGRYAIAFGSKAGLSVDNSAEVIDFMSEAAPVFVDLSLDARAPSSFVFSPPGAFTHKVAVAPQPNALQIIDLDKPQLGPISITLTAQTSLVPEQILFAGDRIFVRSQGSQQIVILQAIDVPRGAHSWQPAPQQQFASGVVQDIAVTGQGDKQRLLALTSALEVFDPAIGPTARIDGVAGFNRILQFTGRSPVDPNVTSRAMLYGAQSRTQVGFVDLGDETAWTTRNIELVELGESIASLTRLEERNAVVARHGSERASVLDLDARTVRRLVLNEYAGTLLVDEDSPTSQDAQLWALGTGGQLGRVNLTSFARIELPFSLGDTVQAPQTNERLFMVPSATRRRIAVVQPAESGRVTFVDADAATSEDAAKSALEVLGIYLPELLD